MKTGKRNNEASSAKLSLAHVCLHANLHTASHDPAFSGILLLSFRIKLVNSRHGPNIFQRPKVRNQQQSSRVSTFC